MSLARSHKDRMDKIRAARDKQHIKPLASQDVLNKFLNQDVDMKFIDDSDVYSAYGARIRGFDLHASKDDVINLLESIDTDNPIDNVLEPVFLSLLDGTMRAFNLGTKQGITASRVYSECKSFTYNEGSKNISLDGYTEYLNEQINVAKFGEQSSYKNGSMTRGEQVINMRDGQKMKSAKENHFDGNLRADDAYGGDSIYQHKKHAKSEGRSEQSAETDHIIPCAEICNKLKSNKALKPEDIKAIVNIDDNLAVTSKNNNRGKNIGKFDKSKPQIQKEIDQGYVEDAKGKKYHLSEEEKNIRRAIVGKMDVAQREVDSKTNRAAIKNIIGDRDVQKKLTADAMDASASQSIGDVVIFMIKPLYFELRDCLVNGVEEGVNCECYGSALKYRLGRVREHVLQEIGSFLESSALNFFKNFLSMLFEGIVNCFVGFFKSIFRMLKEGFKIFLQIIPILKDENKNNMQKGDAILKLICGSISIFAGIGIEGWLNSLGLGEPWSIIMSSIMSAVVTTLIMYILDEIDLFGTNAELKAQRIDEVLNLKIQKSEAEMFESISLMI